MLSMTFRALPIVLLALSTIVFFSGMAEAQDQDSTYTNSIGMKFVLIPAGTFMMGGDKSNEKTLIGELPRHQVTISKPFYLGVYSVTQGQWEAVMGDNPSKFKREDNPVETVSWDDAQEFILRLNEEEGHSRYRLPTEAEWEYAVRAGSTSSYYFGDDKSQLGDHAWYRDNSGETTHPVGEKIPNAWGLYDMIGNVEEWTGDFFGDNYYENSPSEDPTGPLSGEGRVGRGCCWFDYPSSCRSAARRWDETNVRFEIIGFRLALIPPKIARRWDASTGGRGDPEGGTKSQDTPAPRAK
jgi:formylglycine-generating enzyme required for sulfatase activity